MTNEREELIWVAESTHPELAAEVKESLRQVLDPEIGLSVVELGLVRELFIEDNKGHLVMIMTTPFCPYGPALLEMTRQKAESTLKRPTTIEVGMQMWDPSMMEEGAGAEWGLF